MANTVGNLSVILGLNGSQFSKGIDSARKHLGQFGKDFSGLKSIVAGGLGLVGIGLTVNALKGMLGENLKLIDANAKLADSIGTTTENLQAFTDVAALSGVENGNKLLEMMTRKIGEAKAGSVEAGKQFALLGLSADDLANMDTVTAFGQVATAINGMATAADKAAVANKLFGEQGAKLGPLFAAGAAGIDAAREANDKLGISLSRIDAARVEAANDAMTRVGLAVAGVERQITVALAPAIQYTADLMLKWLQDAGGSQAVVNSGFNTMTRSIGGVADAVLYTKSLFDSIRFTVGLIGLAIGGGLYLQVAAVFKIAQGLLSVFGKLAGAAALIAENTPGGESAGRALRGSQADLNRFATYSAAGEAAARELLIGLKDATLEAGDDAIDAWEKASSNAGSKAVEGFIQAAKTKSDETAGAVVAGLPKALTAAVDVAAPAIADTLGTATADAVKMAMPQTSTFSPGRLSAATFGSVEGFRAEAGLQNQPMIILQKEEVKLTEENRDLLREIRDQGADTATVEIL